MFHEMVAEFILCFTNVQEATSGTLDAVDEVRQGALEPLSHLTGLLGSLDGVEGGDFVTGFL